jgi:hypothetical protein
MIKTLTVILGIALGLGFAPEAQARQVCHDVVTMKYVPSHYNHHGHLVRGHYKKVVKRDCYNTHRHSTPVVVIGHRGHHGHHNGNHGGHHGISIKIKI